MNKVNTVINTIRQRKIDQALFFLAVILLIILDYLTAAGFQMLFSGRLTQLIIILLGLKILCTSYTKTEWFLLGTGAVLSLTSYIYTDTYLIALFIMLIMAAKDVEFPKIMKLYVLEVLIITIIVGTLAVLGIRGEIFMERNYRGEGSEIRYCMGFNHPNVYHIILIQLMLACLWLLWDKVKWYYMLPLFVLNCVVTYFTDSRTCFLVGGAAIFSCMIAKWFPKIVQWFGVYISGILVFVIGLIISILAMFSGTNILLLRQINEIWTGRILWAYYSYNSYISERPVSFFADSGDFMRCDMSVISMMLHYGIVMIILLSLIMLCVFMKALKRRDFVLLVSAVACIIFFFGETFSAGEYVTRNLLFVFMLGLGWDDHESIKSKESDC